MAFSTSLFTPGTGSVSVSDATSFDATAQGLICVASDKLATSETLTIFCKVNGVYVPASNMQGTAAQCTATVGTCYLPGGFIYAVAKTATAATCGGFWSGVPYR